MNNLLLQNKKHRKPLKKRVSELKITKIFIAVKLIKKEGKEGGYITKQKLLPEQYNKKGGVNEKSSRVFRWKIY